MPGDYVYYVKMKRFVQIKKQNKIYKNMLTKSSRRVIMYTYLQRYTLKGK